MGCVRGIAALGGQAGGRVLRARNPVMNGSTSAASKVDM